MKLIFGLFAGVCLLVAFCGSISAQTAEDTDRAAEEIPRASVGIKAAEVRAAIKQLGADEFAEREAAAERIFEIGGAAIVPLKEALGSPDPEWLSRQRKSLTF